MTEEQIKQIFKNTYPDFMRGDEPLSPFFDIWEYAIETVTSEMQDEIKDLEWQLREVIKDNDWYQEENEQLKTQMEKMKLCQNCKFEDNDYLEKPCCDCTRCLGDIKRNGNTDKWEVAE